MDPQAILTFDGNHGTDFMDEVAKVINESNGTIERASAYLYAASDVSAVGTAASEVLVFAVQARMAANYLLNKISIYIEELANDGAPIESNSRRCCTP